VSKTKLSILPKKIAVDCEALSTLFFVFNSLSVFDEKSFSGWV
jgi:hypothetical protein